MQPFGNLKVIELASVLAGPAVGMFFAELGAQVVKIENKKTNGDVTRNWKLKKEDPDAPASAYYHSINWGKHSIFLDLKDAGDKEQLLNLIKEADVVLCNFKKGSAAKLGLDYPTIKDVNPTIIYANLTAYGEDDDSPGFDVLLQAETGFLYMNGEPERPPSKMPVALIDLLAAHQLKEAVLIALLKRKENGEGSFISVSLAKSAIASLANQASNYLNVAHIPQRMGSQHPNIAPYGDIFRTKDDKEIILAIGTEKHFQNLCEVLNLESVKTDERFVNNAARVENRQSLIPILQTAVINFNQFELLTRLKELLVPAGVIRNMHEVFEQTYAQEMVLEDEQGNKCVKSVAFEIT